MEQQPYNFNQGQQGTPPPNYLVWAILSTIFCCLPLGIVSIVFAAQVNSKWQMGDIDGAMNSSKNAKTWAWVTFGVGLIVFIVYMALFFLGFLGAFAPEFMDGITDALSS